MLAYWTLTFLIWACVGAYAAPAALAASFGSKHRRGDPMRLAVFLVSTIMVFGNARWIWRPTDETLWKAVLVVAMLTGVYIIFLMRAYGRGPHVEDSTSD